MSDRVQWRIVAALTTIACVLFLVGAIVKATL